MAEATRDGAPGATPADVLLVVRLWVEAGRESDYERFERDAARVLASHGARVERIVRRAGDAADDEPFEVHLVRFPSDAALSAWRDDPATRALAPTRDDVVARTEVFRGRTHPGYGPDDEGAPGDALEDLRDLVESDDVPPVSERWDESPERLETTYRFGSFGEAVDFMGACRPVIDALDHHPDWSNAHRRVHVVLTTHSAGHRVTDLDRRLAAALDRVHARYA